MIADKRKILVRMAEKGWNRSDLAAAMGSTVATISRILNGFPVKTTTFKSLADALGIGVDELMAEEQ